jgi:hypothetical protein
MLFGILKHTPVWVWGLLALLLYFGYQRSKPHSLAKQRVIILPGIMILLSVFGMWSAFGTSPYALVPWACGAALAILLNRLLRLPKGVSYDPATRRFTVPGSWVPMMLMMAIFATKYVVGVTTAINQPFAASDLFVASTSLVYGFISGSFFSRSMRTLSAAKPEANAEIAVGAGAAD